MVSGLLVNSLIIAPGKKKDMEKKISEIRITTLEARPRILSTVCLSPFPQYCAHNTLVPADSP